MQLVCLDYSEYGNSPLIWTLHGLKLRDRNLLVGRNSSGKTRTLNVIDSLSLHLCQLRPAPPTGTFDATFNDEQETSVYHLEFKNGEVAAEQFSINGKLLLERGQGGIGRIVASAIKGTEFIDFQSPPSTLAAVAKLDSIQHPFLAKLNAWAQSVRHFNFGTQLGRDVLAMINDVNPPPLNERDDRGTLAVYKAGERLFNEPFKAAIVRDMCSVGYDIEDVGLAAPVSISFQGAPGPLVGLYVKERNLSERTDQAAISQGMFRALALFIHVNYCEFRKSASCLLIDDIGEGLDYERSTLIIDSLRKRAKANGIQLVMTTNDRFVMNSVPLDEWSILQRKGGVVSVRNHENSKKEFEEFKFTGLSNFSFLELDILGRDDSEPKH